MKVLLLLLLMGQAAAQQRGLFPAILNLASNAVISSNATCGDPEPEVYCKLVEHVPGRRIKNPHCLKCDANSVLSRERHPITNAIDGTNRWWQSPSIKNGQQFHWITITLDLKQVFQIAYIIIKAANSPRAGNWILERSLDGVSFEPWQFYAISDSECLYRYNITPRLGPPTYKRDTEVICTSYYSRLNPLEHGEIHTSLINGRPGADDLTSDLLNFTSARYIRLRLQRIRTLNADLMTLSARDPRDIDPIVTRRYYYSIKDISVGGMCICYGHAQSCPLDPVSKKLHCVCEHNTCGESCNECCPGYHQQPWQPGTISDGNTCEKCNCHNKADDCYYNQTISELSLSLNTHGVRQGGGVCFNCQQNTAGINCEICKDGYFRPAEVSPYSDFPCVECKCDLRGSKSSVCARDNTQPGLLAGQCMCKEGFAGQQCDRCAFGYRDFPQCFRCECSLSGSINTDPCSPCICKENVMGAHCDLCKPGFFNLQESNPLGCTSCFCFGVSDVCESSGLSIGQVVTAEALLFPSETITTTPVLHSNEIPIHSNISSGATHQQMLWWAAPQSFLGNKLLSYGGFLNYFVVYDAPLDFENPTLSAHCDIIIKGNGLALRLPHLLPLSLSTLAKQLVNVPMVWQQFAYDQTGRHVTRDDLLLVLADVTSLVVRVYLNTSATGTIRSVSLDIGDASSHSEVQALAVERCECPWGYSGTSCESCLPGFYRVGGILFGGNCMQCECNDHAAECDINGVCVGCTHNTTGPHCDQCLLGFYGDATEGTTDDCQLCPCPLTKPSNRFSPTCVLDASGQVLCDQCQDGYTGTNCEKCASGFYGNPQVVGGTCVRCECNGNVDISEAGHCDTVTGECLRCLGNTAGRHCELCRPGYYGDAVHTKDCRGCSRTYEQEYGYLKSPGWPDIYPNNMDCTIILKAPQSNYISFFFNNFDVESHSNCQFDYLEIRNGSTADSPLIGKFCGSTLPSPVFPQSNQLYLRFKSDFSHSRDGFDATWTSSPQGCGGTLFGDQGSFASPNYPGTYPNNTHCEWSIMAPRGRVVTITFNQISIDDPGDCQSNFLKLYDGPDTSSQFVGPYCGVETNIAPFTATAHQVYVVFQGQYSTLPSGFRLTWTS